MLLPASCEIFEGVNLDLRSNDDDNNNNDNDNDNNNNDDMTRFGLTLGKKSAR